MQDYEKILDQLIRMVRPEKLILYGTKRDVATGEVRDIDVCIVAETEDKSALERELYLSVDSEVSFDIIVYRPIEWETLITDRQSFAHRILEKGTVVYERQA